MQLVALGGLLLIYGFAWRAVLGRSLLATATSLFLAIQFLSVVGLIFAVDLKEPFQGDWLGLTMLGLATFVGGAWWANRVHSFDGGKEIAAFRSRPLIDFESKQTVAVALGFATLIGLAVGYWFSSRVGYNTFAIAFRQWLSLGSVQQNSFTALRLDSTQSRYVAAGYTAQFVEVILPAIGLLLIARGSLIRKLAPKVAGATLVAVAMMFLTVTGGRKPVIIVLASAALLWMGATGPLPPGMRRGFLASVTALVALMALFGLFTVLQGRADTPQGPGEYVLGGLGDLYNRIGGSESQAQLSAILLLRDQAPVWGRDWYQSLQSVLPGPNPTDLTLAHQIHGLLYGDASGNAPLNVWGSLYYNWGWPGMILIPFVAGYLLQRFTIVNLIRSPRAIHRVILLSMAGYRFALWSDPYSLLLQGGLTLVVLTWIISKSSSEGEDHAGRVTPESREPAEDRLVSSSALLVP